MRCEQGEEEVGAPLIDEVLVSVEPKGLVFNPDVLHAHILSTGIDKKLGDDAHEESNRYTKGEVGGVWGAVGIRRHHKNGSRCHNGADYKYLDRLMG